ncbi:MAG: IS21 family transposase [Deltaproteobacteria bacterium]|nr:IS21 family transposase [Deltaproteobacteria bacterium]
MKTVEDYTEIRKAYFVEGKSIRAIHRELGFDRETIRKAIVEPVPQPYQLEQERPAPVLGTYKARVHELLEESKTLPRKQRYTARKIFQIIRTEGYQGSEGGVHNYVCQQRKTLKRKRAYLPLEFDIGQDAQMDWGEAVVRMAGEAIKVQFFSMRLNYSKARFVMAFPFQKQEAFLEGHIQAFHFFGGVVPRITYDNLKTAVYRILEGKKRHEQQSFKKFRSYYLYESRYCTPGQPHEKGGVENDVGYAQRNFFSPIPEMDSFEELNNKLRQACFQDAQRRTRGQTELVADLWEKEKEHFLPLPIKDYQACITNVVRPNTYLLVDHDTNRYSVPYKYRDTQLVMRVYAFQIELVYIDDVIATHPRCFQREQDILDPLHYLPLLQQRPGAFEHAKPLRQWQQSWPESYEQILHALRTNKPEGQGVKEFLDILKLHQDHPGQLVEKAVKMAVGFGAAHLDGVQLCLRQLASPKEPVKPIDLDFRPELSQIGSQPVNLEQYDQLSGVR